MGTKRKDAEETQEEAREMGLSTKDCGRERKELQEFEGEGYSYVQSIILSTQMHVFIYICAWTLVF